MLMYCDLWPKEFKIEYQTGLLLATLQYSILAQCNGIQDCFGGDDEQFCPTFNCNNGTALTYAQKCDGFPDCPDGEDEDDCLGKRPFKY